MICPRGSYSDTDMSTDCTECPEGQTTDQEGSTNSSNCQGSKIVIVLALYYLRGNVSQINMLNIT